MSSYKLFLIILLYHDNWVTSSFLRLILFLFFFDLPEDRRLSLSLHDANKDKIPTWMTRVVRCYHVNCASSNYINISFLVSGQISVVKDRRRYSSVSGY